LKFSTTKNIFYIFVTINFKPSKPQCDFNDCFLLATLILSLSLSLSLLSTSNIHILSCHRSFLQAFRPGVVDLPASAAVANVTAITMPELTEDALMEDNLCVTHPFTPYIPSFTLKSSTHTTQSKQCETDKQFFFFFCLFVLKFKKNVWYLMNFRFVPSLIEPIRHHLEITVSRPQDITLQEATFVDDVIMAAAPGQCLVIANCEY
jgi:hypothetical protein